MIKNLLIIVVLLIISTTIFAQTFDDKSVSQLTSLKKKAVSNQDYELAAKYKKAIEIKGELSKAVKAEDYSKAASLKKELSALNGSASLSNSKNGSPTQTAKGSEALYANTVYLRNNVTGEDKKLEMQDAKFAIETYSAFYVAGSSSFWTVKGYYSPVQLTDKDDFTFIIKMSGSVDPASIVTLVKLNLLGKESLNRKQLDSKTTAAAYAGAQTKSNLSQNVPITFKDIGDDIYEIVIDQMILPGEYAFKYGIKWYLFGTKDRISNNPEFPITESNYELKDFYHLPIDAPNISWLGIDCSLFRMRSDNNVGKESQIKSIILSGQNINRLKYMNHGKMEAWFDKKTRMNYLPAFGYDNTLGNMPDKWVIPRSNDYKPLSQEDIEKHIAAYKINMPGIGMVLIPEISDRVSSKQISYMVIFDFESRKILKMQKLVSKIVVGKSPNDVAFAKSFLVSTKLYVDKYYRPAL